MSELDDIRAGMRLQTEALTILAETIATLAEIIARVSGVDAAQVERLEAMTAALKHLGLRVPR